MKGRITVSLLWDIRRHWGAAWNLTPLWYDSSLVRGLGIDLPVKAWAGIIYEPGDREN